MAIAHGGIDAMHQEMYNLIGQFQSQIDNLSNQYIDALNLVQTELDQAVQNNIAHLETIRAMLEDHVAETA